jgi:hypothetical protein
MNGVLQENWNLLSDYLLRAARTRADTSLLKVSEKHWYVVRYTIHEQPIQSAVQCAQSPHVDEQYTVKGAKQCILPFQSMVFTPSTLAGVLASVYKFFFKSIM